MPRMKNESIVQFRIVTKADGTSSLEMRERLVSETPSGFVRFADFGDFRPVPIVHEAFVPESTATETDQGKI
jgi:hypothetical protein